MASYGVQSPMVQPTARTGHVQLWWIRYGGKAGEGLTEEKTADAGLPAGLQWTGEKRISHGDRSRRRMELQQVSRVKRRIQGREAGFRLGGNLDLPHGEGGAAAES